MRGRLANLGHRISDTTVGNILKAHGIEPAPQRKHQTTWKTFIKAHWEVLAAIDFTTVEVWTPRGLVTYYLLFVMEVASRRVHLAGCRTGPNEALMKQMARNLTDPLIGFLRNKRYPLMDRDTTYKKRTVKTIPPRRDADSFIGRFGGLSPFAAGPSFHFSFGGLQLASADRALPTECSSLDLSHRWADRSLGRRTRPRVTLYH